MCAQVKQREHENYKAERARKEYQEDVKIIDVQYIDSYVENQAKPVNEVSLSRQSAGLTRAAIR